VHVDLISEHVYLSFILIPVETLIKGPVKYSYLYKDPWLTIRRLAYLSNNILASTVYKRPARNVDIRR